MTLLPIHIIGGAIGIVSGFVALYAVKGATLHRKSGMIFVYAMLVMSVSAAVMAALKPNWANTLQGMLTCYFLGQAKVIPKPIRIIPLLAILALLPLVLMLYWLARVLFTKRVSL